MENNLHPQEIKDLIEKTKRIKDKGWIPNIVKGSGSVGRTFEDALGLSENDLEIPDYEGLVEIKTKSIREDNLYKNINLFSAAPDSYLYEIKRIVNTYGYPYYKDKNLKVFYLSFCANKTKWTRKYLYKLEVNREKKQIILNIYDKYTGKLVDNDVAWSFDILEEKLNRKLKYLFYVKAKRKFEHNQLFFHYVDSKLYVLKNFDHFLKAIENGYIRITFKIGVYIKGPKYGKIKDHGTSFDLDENYLEEVFDLLNFN